MSRSFSFSTFSVILLLSVLSVCSFAARLDFSSQKFLKEIKTSQERYYNQKIRFYDSLFARTHKTEVLLEKCRFMESALYDPESEENPKYADWEMEYRKLVKSYPNDIGVNLYHLEKLYNDSTMMLSNEILEKIGRKEIVTDSHNIAKVYRSLAYAYYSQDSAKKAIMACRAALEVDDTCNIYLLLARSQKALGLRVRARESLVQGNVRLNPWERNQAGKILLELRYPEDALRFYEKALADTSVYTDYSEVASAYEQNGALDSARKYHKLALEHLYDTRQASQKLFEFDLRNSSGKLALDSYRAFRDNGLKADPFSFYRIRLFFKHPFQPLMWRELLGILLLALLCFSAFLIPYIWVLPLHYVGTWLRSRSQEMRTIFTLRHLWIVSAGMVLASFFSIGLFQDPTLRALIGEGASERPAQDYQNALFFAAYCGMMSAMVLGLVVRTKTWALLKPRQDVGSIIGNLIGFFIVMLIVRKANSWLFPDISREIVKEIGTGSIFVYMKSTLLTMGIFPTLVMVGVLVPIYEEYLFRGVGIEAMQRYFPFWLANTLQAVAFSLMHDEIRLFPFYFIFGIILGWLYRSTKSLYVPVLFHSLNNILAVVGLWRMILKHGY